MQKVIQLLLSKKAELELFIPEIQHLYRKNIVERDRIVHQYKEYIKELEEAIDKLQS